MHASYWDRIDDPLLDGVTKVDDDSQVAGIAGGCAVGWDPCVQMFPEAMPDEIRAVKERFVAAVPELHRMVGRLTQTVIHGDLRLDNMMFGDTSDLRPVVLLDWTLTKTSGLHDVAYLVSQNVDLEERRAHEAEIIEHYHRGLLDHGVEGYSLEQCWADYRLAVLHLFAYAVVIAGTLDPSNDRRRGVHEAVAAPILVGGDGPRIADAAPRGHLVHRTLSFRSRSACRERQSCLVERSGAGACGPSPAQWYDTELYGSVCECASRRLLCGAGGLHATRCPRAARP